MAGIHCENVQTLSACRIGGWRSLEGLLIYSNSWLRDGVVGFVERRRLACA